MGSPLIISSLAQPGVQISLFLTIIFFTMSMHSVNSKGTMSKTWRHENYCQSHQIWMSWSLDPNGFDMVHFELQLAVIILFNLCSRRAIISTWIPAQQKPQETVRTISRFSLWVLMVDIWSSLSSRYLQHYPYAFMTHFSWGKIYAKNVALINMQFNISPHFQEGDLSYVRTIRGSLTPAPPCKNCKSKYKLHR